MLGSKEMRSTGWPKAPIKQLKRRSYVVYDKLSALLPDHEQATEASHNEPIKDLTEEADRARLLHQMTPLRYMRDIEEGDDDIGNAEEPMMNTVV